MYYYTIAIPRHTDGKIATYSPNWFGVMARCPKNVTVEIFNDKEGWLLAKVDDTYIPPEVMVITEEEALALKSKTKTSTSDGVYASKTAIAKRWADLEAARQEEIAIELQRIADQQARLLESAIEAVPNG